MVTYIRPSQRYSARQFLYEASFAFTRYGDDDADFYALITAAMLLAISYHAQSAHLLTQRNALPMLAPPLLVVASSAVNI